jgi:hypothetical protein
VCVCVCVCVYVERVTATSVALMANYCGSGVGFLVALPITSTRDVRLLLFIEAGCALLVLALCVLDHIIFKTSLPPLPPSQSSRVEKVPDFLSDFKKLIGSSSYMLLTLCYGISLGAYSGILDNLILGIIAKQLLIYPLSLILSVTKKYCMSLYGQSCLHQ